MNWLPPLLIPLLIIGGWVYMLMRRNRERARNEPLRAEIAAQVCFETILYRASKTWDGRIRRHPRSVDFVEGPLTAARSRLPSGKTTCQISGKHLQEPVPRLCYEPRIRNRQRMSTCRMTCTG